MSHTKTSLGGTPPLHTNAISADEDGVQSSLPSLITANPSIDTLTKILFAMWYIWKARNDHCFNRRTWTSSQIIHVVVADRCNHTSLLSSSAGTTTDPQHQTRRHSQEHDQTQLRSMPGIPSTIAGSNSNPPQKNNLLVALPSMI